MKACLNHRCRCWIFLLGVMLAAGVGRAADGTPRPPFVQRDTFVETMLATRAAYRDWIGKQDARDRAIWQAQRDWRHPLWGTWEGGALRQFRLEAGAVTPKTYNDLPRLLDWLEKDDLATPERAWIDSALQRITESLPDVTAFRKRLDQAYATLTKGNTPEDSRTRLTLLANLSHSERVLQILDSAGLEFTRDCVQALGALPADSRLLAEMNKQRVRDRFHEAERALLALRDATVQAVLQQQDLDAAPCLKSVADFAPLRAEILRLRIRSTGVDEILYAVRTRAGGTHWYESFGYYCDTERWNIQKQGRLAVLDLRTGTSRDLINEPNGAVRDPFVDYDAKKILFSYRPPDTKHYHLYEIGVQGSGLRQLTDGPFDDIEPIYLPDGDILFCSSRARRWVPCLNAQVANLYRCRPDGSGIRAVSANVETENTPWMLPDGRVLFMRWEYVERNRTDFHGLWTINPDGTGQMTYWGNLNEPQVFIDAKPVPGTDEVVFIAHGHGSPDHQGSVNLLHDKKGPDDHSTITPLTGPLSDGSPRQRDRLFRDPYALSSDLFLVCRWHELYVLDRQGRMGKLLELAEGKGGAWVHEPRPLVARSREPVIPARIDDGKTAGRFLLSEVNHGRNMKGVAPGEIEKLLVLEVLPKPVHHNGHTENISWNGSFFIERILGTVPVESDGSAYFEAPAMRCLFFVALDRQGQAVKRMQSFVSLMPGEVASCVGCHEHRTEVSRRRSSLLALEKPPATIHPLSGIPPIYHYPRDIQPILDRHCVRCHDNDTREGNVLLNGDLDPFFSQSYVTLRARRLYAAGFGGCDGRGNLPPRSVGATASRLMKLVDGSHYEIKLSQQEQDMLRYWIEAWCQYAGTYACLNDDPGDRVLVDKDVLKRRCSSCHADMFFIGHHEDPVMPDLRETFGLRVNLTHPEQSLLLRAPLAKEAGGLALCRRRPATPFGPYSVPPENWSLKDGPVAVTFTDTSDPDFQKLSADIKAAAAKELVRRVEIPGYVANPIYLREMKRYGVLPQDFDPAGKPLEFWLHTDEAYFRLFRPQPRATTAAAKDSIQEEQR